MLIDNVLLTGLMLFQTLVITLGVCFYIYKSVKKKNDIKEAVVEIDDMPELTEGFGYASGKSLVLNKDGAPYVYKTYAEALKNKKKVKGVTKIIYQKWDADTQTVFVGEVNKAWDKQTTSG